MEKLEKNEKKLKKQLKIYIKKVQELEGSTFSFFLNYYYLLLFKVILMVTDSCAMCSISGSGEPAQAGQAGDTSEERERLRRHAGVPQRRRGSADQDAYHR